MARFLYLVRFFRIVSPMPPLMGVTFVATTLACAAVVAIEPARVPQALTPLLMLQLFACSSGFLIPARRGHYDLLLTAGETRLRIAMAHWMMSLLPGVACWIAVAAVEAVATHGARTMAWASGSVLAWVLVSTLPWATTVALPRFAGAIGWLLALAVLAATIPAAVDGHLFDRVGAGASWLEAAVALLVFPPLMVGKDVVGSQGWLAVPALLVAVVSMVHAFGWIEHQDIPLEAAQ
jgi:hypothetical protein